MSTDDGNVDNNQHITWGVHLVYAKLHELLIDHWEQQTADDDNHARWSNTSQLSRRIFRRRIFKCWTITNNNTRSTALCLQNRVSWYQKSKTSLDFTEARNSKWQWYQLGHMQISTSLQTDNHANTLPLQKL